MTSSFIQIDGLDSVYVARRGKLSCVAFRLKTGDMCLYSPISGLGSVVANEMARLGHLSVLLAPNHYHNKGLQEHVALFPQATLVASAFAANRLKKVTGLDTSDLAVLRRVLPDTAQILEPEGLKTGEVWLQMQSGAEVAWIVTDAFSAPHTKPGQFAENLTLLGTFPKYGIKDAEVYKAWVAEQISRHSPTLLIPCHGSPVRDPNMGTSLLHLLDTIP